MQENEGAIVTQAQQERKTRLRWLVAVSAFPLFGMVAAFGIAPQAEPDNVPVQTVIQDIPLPQATRTAEAASDYWYEERIQRGDTVASLLSRLNVHDPAALGFLHGAKDARTLYQLIPGRTIRAKTTEDGDLLALDYVNSDHTQLTVTREGDTFKASEQPAQLEQRIQMRSGEITSSLFGATDAAGVPDSVALQLADIFSSDIDFHLDIRKGDRFTVLYETFYSNGELINTGRVLAAEYTNDGKTYRAVYYTDPTGKGGYYSPDGKNLRKAFLKSPLEFSRISSGFTTARYHPILKTWRAHKGVDYAAPIGAHIKAVADGVVAFAGVQRGYGNIIILQHRGTYSTVYGHLSRFAKGLHAGTRVHQGDVIAYVGMTGLATGPHLHYEFRVAGVQRNPLAVAMPPAFPVAPLYKADFNHETQPLMARLEMLKGLNIASLD